VLDGLIARRAEGQRIALIGSERRRQDDAVPLPARRIYLSRPHRHRRPRSARDRTQVLRVIAFVPQIAPRLVMPVGALMRYVAEVCGAQVDRMVAVAAASASSRTKSASDPSCASRAA
jgi:hypothetical protein